jgi:hypothetical protein
MAIFGKGHGCSSASGDVEFISTTIEGMEVSQQTTALVMTW